MCSGECARAVRTSCSSVNLSIASTGSAEASSRAIAEGTTITPDMLKMVRPASGLAPTLSQAVIGRRARHAIPADTLLSWEDLA